jgi:hypothetical protein
MATATALVATTGLALDLRSMPRRDALRTNGRDASDLNRR